MPVYSSYPTGSFILHGGKTELPRKGFKFRKYPSWGTIAKSDSDPHLIYVFEPFNGKESWGDGPYPLAFQRANGAWVRYDWNKEVNAFESIGFSSVSRQLSITPGNNIDVIRFNAIKEETLEELESKLDDVIDLSEELTDKINTDEILNFSPDSLKWWVKDILHGGQSDLNLLNDLSSIKQDISDARSIIDQISDKILCALSPLGLKGVDENGKIFVKDYVPVDPNSTNMMEDIESLSSKWDSIDSAGIQTVIDKIENYQSPIKSGNTLGDDLKDIETMYQILSDATSGSPISSRVDNITLNYEKITQNVGLNVDQSFTSIPHIGDGTHQSISETLSYMSTNLIDKNDDKLAFINSSGRLIKESNTGIRYDHYYQEIVYVDEDDKNTFIYLQGKKTEMSYQHTSEGFSVLTYLDEDTTPQSTDHLISGQLTQLSFDSVGNRLVFLDEKGDENYVIIPAGIQNITTDLQYIDAGQPIWDSLEEEWDLGDSAKLVYTDEERDSYDITIEERDNLYIYTPEDNTYWPDNLEDTMDGTPVWIGEDIATHLFRLDYIPFYKNSTLNEIRGYPSNDVDAEFWFRKLPGGYVKFSQWGGGEVVQGNTYKSDYEYFYYPGAGQDKETYTLTRGSWQEFISNDPPFRRVDSYGSPAEFDHFSVSRLNNFESANLSSKYIDLDNLLSIENPLTKYLVYIDEDKIPNAVPCGKDNLTTMYTELPQNIEELYPGIDLDDAKPSGKSLHYIDERYLDGSQITKITLPPDKITSLIETDGDLLLVHEGLDSAGLASEDDWLRIHSNVKDYDKNRTYGPEEMAYFNVVNEGLSSLSKNQDLGISKVIKILTHDEEWRNIYGDFLDGVESIKSENDQSDRISYDSAAESFIFTKGGNVYSEPQYPFRLKNNLVMGEHNDLKSELLEINLQSSDSNVNLKTIISPEVDKSNVKFVSWNVQDPAAHYPRKEDCKEYSPDQNGGVQTIDLSYRNHFIYVDDVSNRFVAKLDDGLYKGQEIRIWLCSNNSLDSDAEFLKFNLQDEIRKYDSKYLTNALLANNDRVEDYQHTYRVGSKYTPPIGYSANMLENWQTTGNVSVQKYRRKIKSDYRWNSSQTFQTSTGVNLENIHSIGQFLEKLNGKIIDRDKNSSIQIIYDEIVSAEGTGLPIPNKIEDAAIYFERGNNYLTDVNFIKHVSSPDYDPKTKEIGKPLIIVKNAKYKSIKTSGEPDSKYFQEFPIREDYQYLMAEPEIVKFKVTSTTEWQEERFQNSKNSINEDGDNDGVWTGDYWWKHDFVTLWKGDGPTNSGLSNLGYYHEYIWDLNRIDNEGGHGPYEYKYKGGAEGYNTVTGGRTERTGRTINGSFIYTNRKSWTIYREDGDPGSGVIGNDSLWIDVPSTLKFSNGYEFNRSYKVSSQQRLNSFNWSNNYSPQYVFYVHQQAGKHRLTTNRSFPNPPVNMHYILSRQGYRTYYLKSHGQDQDRIVQTSRRQYWTVWNKHYTDRSLPGQSSLESDASSNSLRAMYERVGIHMPEDSYFITRDNFVYSKQINHLTKEQAHKPITYKDIEGGYIFLDKRISENGPTSSKWMFDHDLDDRVDLEDSGNIVRGNVKKKSREESYLHEPLSEVYEDHEDAILFHLDDQDNIISISKPNFNLPWSLQKIFSSVTEATSAEGQVLNIESFENKLRAGDSLVLHYPKKVITKNYLEYKTYKHYSAFDTDASSIQNVIKDSEITKFTEIKERYRQAFLGISLSNFYEIVKENNGTPYMYDSAGDQVPLKSHIYIEFDSAGDPRSRKTYHAPAQKFQHTVKVNGQENPPIHDPKPDYQNFHGFFYNKTDNHNFTYTNITQLNQEKPYYRFPEFLDNNDSPVYDFKSIVKLKVEGLMTSVTNVVNPIATISTENRYDLNAWNSLHRFGYFTFNDSDTLTGSKDQTSGITEKSNVHWGLFEFENTGEWDIKENKISECYYLGIPKPKYIDSSPLMYRCIWNGNHWILLDGSCDEDFGFDTPANIWN